MALKQFVIPLDSDSVQSGNITFRQLVANEQPVTFQLSNAKAGNGDLLDLVTKNNGVQISHKFAVTVSGTNAQVQLSVTDMRNVYGDCDNNEWDYVRADWTLGGVDTPDPSNQFELQSGNTYDTHWFPPRPKH